MMCTHIDLQDILRARIGNIDRWRKVTVYKWNSKRLPWYIDRPIWGMAYIVWSRPKRGNIHDVEHKEFPLTDLDKVINRNRRRLRDKTKEHK